jgi:two-component system, cell cycle sensor histidine kinase and response regulator CckA
MSLVASAEKARILVVEDDALIARDVCRRIERLGYDIVDVCDSVERALFAMQEARPDLLLMDVCLNGVDGVHAAMEIRRGLDVPVLFLTAHSDRATLNRVKLANPDGFVLKPFHQRELMVAIEFALHRHQIDRELKASERRYAATLANVVDAVIATDRHGRITFMNPAAQSLTGRPFDESRGMPVDDIVPLRSETTGVPLLSPVGEALASRTTVRVAVPAMLVCGDGTQVPVDYHASAIIEVDSRLSGAVMVFRDLRQQREIERTIRRVEEEQRHLQRIETIGRLAAGVAHDFNNVLTVIGGDAELALAHEPLHEDIKIILQQISDAVGRGAALTRQLLVFSRKQQTEERVVDVNEFIYGVRHMMTRLLGEAITLDITTDGAPAQISIDLSQLEVIILNLAANARDAMVRGGALSINVEQADVVEHPDRPGLRAGRYVKISVTDQGEGIPPAVVRRIFEPFFTTKAVGQGTGLGLATVYSAVKRFGGYIYVERTGATGTTFSIYFRATEAVRRPDACPEPSALTGSETILLVEDDERVRQVAGAALRKKGYRVLESGTPSEATRIATAHTAPIHLVVSDVALPEMTGDRLTAELRVARPDMKVLLMSGSPDDVLAMHDLELADVLRKPFTPTSLANRVWSTLHDPGAHNPGGHTPPMNGQHNWGGHANAHR